VTLDNLLMALVTAMVSIVGVMAALLYKDVIRRLSSLDKKSAASLTILTVLVGHIPDLTPQLLTTIKTAIAESASD
jgi:hypothetical protein